jgi:TctA family transporter
MKEKKTKRKSKYHALDLYICFCFICIIIYTIVHTIIFYQNGTEANVLSALFYGVFGGEVLLCALLKRLKLKQEFELKKVGQKEESVFSCNSENTFIEE